MNDRSFPIAHPRPAHGWVNDPNGLLLHEGRWHLYFQHNPESAEHHRIVWGHLSSADLAHWREEPVALEPQDGGDDEFGCWSGVSTLDDDGHPAFVYSGVLDPEGRSTALVVHRDPETLGYTGARLPAARMPEDPEVIAMRDPFVFTFAGRRWVIQGAGLANGSGALLLFDATDLDSWSYEGRLLDAKDPALDGALHASIWECPQLVPADDGENWILLISRWILRPDGGADLLDTVWAVGTLEERSAEGQPPLAFVPNTSGRLDAGDSFYAPQALALPGRNLLWGWARESRPQEEADQAGWSGVLTWPREVSVRDGRVHTEPARECSQLRTGEVAVPSSRWTELPDATDIEAAASHMVVALAEGDRRRVVWEGTADRVVIDASLLEVFPATGMPVTLRAYPADGERWTVFSDGDVRAWELGPSMP